MFFFNIWGNKEMYQRKIISGIVIVFSQLVTFDCSRANLSHWGGGSFNQTVLQLT